MIVVLAVAADIDHGIDGGRAAQAFPPGLEAQAAIEALLGDRFHFPVVDGLGEHGHGTGRHVDQQPVTTAASFQQADTGIRILTESPGQGTTSRSTTDDQIIKFIFHDSSPLLYRLFYWVEKQVSTGFAER